jgi:hypothetical protein
MEERNMFHTLESSLREVKELHKENPHAEGTLFIKLKEEEEMENKEKS